MGAIRMKSWRDHPAVTGQAAKSVSTPDHLPQLPPVGRYAVHPFAGRFAVVNHAGSAVATLKVSRRDAEELAHKLNETAEREERFGRAMRRPCLCCEREFTSEGIHNRLCPYCRHLDHAPMTR